MYALLSSGGVPLLGGHLLGGLSGQAHSMMSRRVSLERWPPKVGSCCAADQERPTHHSDGLQGSIPRSISADCGLQFGGQTHSFAQCTALTHDASNIQLLWSLAAEPQVCSRDMACSRSPAAVTSCGESLSVHCCMPHLTFLVSVNVQEHAGILPAGMKTQSLP